MELAHHRKPGLVPRPLLIVSCSGLPQMVTLILFTSHKNIFYPGMLSNLPLGKKKKKSRKDSKKKNQHTFQTSAIQNQVADTRQKNSVALLIKAADGTFEPTPLTQTLGTVLQNVIPGKDMDLRTRRQAASTPLTFSVSHFPRCLGGRKPRPD